MIAYFDLDAWGAQLARMLRVLWGSLIDIAFAVFLLLALGTAINLVIWRVRRRRAARQAHRAKFRPDGRAYPPTDMGVCDRCGAAARKVFYMPSGQRLCGVCYDAAEGPQAAPAAGQGRGKSTSTAGRVPAPTRKAGSSDVPEADP